ncbi:MAG: Ig domain-containing protein [Thermoguttaceae bacterium]
MATRFVRVDLSETARDYRPIAVEPGVPMLDRSGANARVLFRWLGGMVAEPVWEGDTVGFYVRDDKGGRLEEVICQPATAQDLQGLLRDDLAKLRQRLNQSRGETPTERTLRKVLVRTFDELVDNPAHTDLDSYFFRYRDVLGNWRLIWCWGYERLDHEPAPSVVCTDPDCNLLFVRRPGKSPRCPSCEGLLQTRPKHKTDWRIAALAGLLLLLLLGGVGWWLRRPAALVATPATITGPVGTRIDCQVMEKGLFKKKDVTRGAIGITCDPRVARFNQATASIRLTGVGRTKIEFQYDNRKAEVTVVATPSANPDKLVIMPGTVDLAVGTTARLKAFGEYKDGTRVDLTEATVWVPQNDGKVFAQGSLVEGLAPGSSTVGARYRGAPDRPYVEAAATVNVAKGDFQSIDVGVDPSTVGVGLYGKVHVDAITSDGKHYNLLESSQLKTEVSPSYLAALRRDSLQGQRVGTGKLAVAFGSGLTGSSDFAVALPPAFASAVYPDSLDLAVGEIADIACISPDRSPIHLSCSKAGIVEITADNRLIGRAVGDAQITVNQSGRTLGSVAISVAKYDFQGIFFDPGSLAVEVDDTVHPKVFATVAGSDPPRNAEIAPERIATEKKPSPEFAGFDVKTFELSGEKPTNSSSPQELAVRMGNWNAAAPVEVVMAPCRLELTPAGPIDLPLGQMMRLQGFASYSGGRNVQVRSERLKWFSQEKAVPGLELYDKDEAIGAVGALKAGAGPLNVYANYHGQESNRVAFKSVEADPNVKLDIDVDRTLRVAGEQGRVVLTASGPSGDVELVPSLTSFKGSNNKVLKVAERKGTFGTGTPGDAMVTGSHPAAKDPAKKAFRVCDPAKAKLVFDPASVRVLVNQKAALPLFLVEMEADGKKEKQRAELLGQGVGYYVAQPLAVRFYPPILTGLSAADPFDISGSIPVLSRPATAKVEVVDAESKALRITPSAASPLAPGQSVALTVEQQVGESDAWQEIRPDAVNWNVPAQVIWTPPTESLRPTVKLLPDLKGDVKLYASVAGNTASVVFTLKEAGPDAKDPAARLVLDREPGGKLLPVGQCQRYVVLVEKDGQKEPAAGVHWPENFENEYVKWEAPVLTAKRENYTQFLRAEVGGRSVLWHTTTYRPGEFALEPPADQEEKRPDWVKIFSQQGPQQVQQVRFAVGATFTDFKVEVHYPDGYTRFVTKKAILRTPERASEAILTAEHGKFLGLRPGSTNVTAEFQGMTSTVPLTVDVSAEVEIDKITVEPGNALLRPGETYELRAIGYKDGKSVGDITGLGGLTWKSSKPEVARISGSAVIAASLGQSEVSVERKGLLSQPAQVTVSNTIAEDLRVEPKTIEMLVGESQQLGDSIRITRGGLDVSQQATAVPESPGVVRFDPATRTLTAVGTGEVPLGVTMGDKIARVLVVVRPRGAEVGSKLVVEPGSLILAPGQADRLTAYLETPSGEKITTMAAYTVANPSVAGVDEPIGRIRALKPGKTKVNVFVVGQEATVPVEVTNEEITELRADPPALEMASGDHQHLQLFGRAVTSGLKEMFPQTDLKVAPQKFTTVDVIGGEDVQAKAIGDDTIDVSWRDKIKITVPVKVAANTITDLQIAPNSTTVNTGQAVPYLVSAMRGGNRVVLTLEDGLRLNVTDPTVAGVAAGTTVVGTGPGETKVIADYGGQKTEAVLTVTPGGAGVALVGNGVDVIRNGVVYNGHGDRVVIGDGDSVVKPAGKVVALVFEPPFYRQGIQAIPQTAKLHLQYENGGFDDVSNDSNVKVTDPDSRVAKIEKVDGGWKVTPVAPGMTKMTAALNDQTAGMAIEILGDAAPGVPVSGRLVVPEVLSLWSGETQAIRNAVVDPGGGQAPVPVEVTVKAPDGQGIVSAEGNKVTGRSAGDVPVTVSTAGGQSATVNVHVSTADSVYFNPPDLNLQAGESHPVTVMARSADGTEVAVQTPIESLDKNVLDADPAQPGQFMARSQGQTQLHAIYRGKEAFAKVSVSGRRFESVRSLHNRIDHDHFDMTIEVLAAGGEGELEYRVYPEGEANPKENWVPNQPEGNSRKATLRSDPLSYGSGEQYHLVIEARDKNTKSVQKYPLTLVRSVTVEQAPEKDSPQPNEPK